MPTAEHKKSSMKTSARAEGKPEKSPDIKLLLEKLKNGSEKTQCLLRAPGRGSMPGMRCARGRSDLLDSLCRSIFSQVTGSADIPVALAAVGGYGRRELAPFSDIDLIFILPEKKTESTIKTVERFLYILWDLGIKTGYSVRTIKETVRIASSDHAVLTSLLDMRFLAGDKNLFSLTEKQIGDKVFNRAPSVFVAEKLKERDRRHEKFGDSRYQLEPNIKEGKGGLRDLQTLMWIGRYVYNAKAPDNLAEHGVLTRQEAGRFTKAYNFLWTVRWHVHDIAGRAEERLSFDIQPEIARRLGFKDRASNRAVERFMKLYFLIAKETGGLTRILCAALEAEAIDGAATTAAHRRLFQKNVEEFRVVSNRLAHAGADHFKKNPADMVRLFRVAQKTKLDIHPTTLKSLTRNLARIDARICRNKEANSLFLDILTDEKAPAVALRRMSEAGVLGRFVPEFRRIIAQMQYDMYHVYTVDEHTIHTIDILNRLEKGELKNQAPLSSRLAHQIQSRQALYVALFLHDVAKGSGGKHSQIGEKITKKLGARFGLDPEETETAAWLVGAHLIMSHTAEKRELADEKTITDFAAAIQSPERLKLLTVMTTADIMAVGPGRWNNWKAALIEELYLRTEAFLIGSSAAFPDKSVFSKAQNKALAQARKSKDPLEIVVENNPDLASTEILICTPDRKGLFALLAGAFSACGLNIVSARADTTAAGLAVDIFQVQDINANPVENDRQIKKLKTLIADVLTGGADIGSAITKRRDRHKGKQDLFNVIPRVIVDNEASNIHTVIEINGQDRIGLLYEVCSTLTEMGLQISTAKISTYGSKAVDVFYIKDGFGLKILSAERLEEIRETLLEKLKVC